MNRSLAPACTVSKDAPCAGPIRSPTRFFLLVFALSVPFWLVGTMTGLQLMPGLSLSALMTFCPLVAALILVHRENGVAGQVKLLSRAFDFKRIGAKRWYVPIILLMAGVNVIAYGVMRWMDLPLPAPQIQVAAAALMFVAFFVGALGEELGWSGYITGPAATMECAADRPRAGSRGGSYGTSFLCFCRIGRRAGSLGGACMPWRHGFSSSGSTTTRVKACSAWRCSIRR